jgi:hypothetical protein
VGTVTRHGQDLSCEVVRFCPQGEHIQNVADSSRQANLLSVKMSNVQLKQAAKATDQYRPLDISKSEIRLISFENATAYNPIHLNLLYASLNDWKPDYVSFRDQNSSMSSSQLSEAWGDRLAATKHEMKDTVLPELYMGGGGGRLRSAAGHNLLGRHC